MPSPSRVALVHDYFTQRGGAERVVGEFARIFPTATIHTSVFDPALLPEPVVAVNVRATPLQGLRRAGVPLASLAPLLPTAFRRHGVDGARLVISSSSAFAHHVRAPRGGVHVAYIHTPPHFLWERDAYFSGRRVRGRALAPLLAYLRRADVAAVREIDAIVANSAYTAERIRQTYGRDATVIHPPVETGRFRPVSERSGRFLVVARLRRHKRLELAMDAARLAGRGLDIIGEGPDEAHLRRVAGPDVRILGHLGDAAVAQAMAQCTALVVPGTEDFGLTMVETLAAGRPVVAFGRGGALEIVDEGVTGTFFHEGTAESLAEAMLRAERLDLDPRELAASAARFDRTAFRDRFTAFLAGLAPAG